jgi:hypothetical protein
MKYACLIYYDEKLEDELARPQWSALVDECLAYGERIRASGHFVGGESLQHSHATTTVQLRNGKVSATDGPFAETKEQLAGFYLIDARDLNEAVQVASKIPPLRFGRVEVRPIRDITAPDRGRPE